MIISVTEFQNYFERYLKLLETEDIIITWNGKKVARLVKYKKENDFAVREDLAAYNDDGREVTYDEYLQIIEDSENRYEYIDGKIYLLPSPSYKHQKAVREILITFSDWFKNKKCEPLISPFDVTLFKGEDINVVQPDLLVICDQEKIDENDRYQGLPELVVEILSVSTKNHDFIRKLDLYRAGGVKEYWIVNPFSEEIYIYVFRENQIKEMVTFKIEEKAKSKVFEGLEVVVQQVFT